MKLKEHQRVPLEVAKQRALECLEKHRFQLIPASMVATAIWPDNDMKAQGAGAAASRILVQLKKEGRAKWSCRQLSSGQEWGWTFVYKGTEK